MKKIIFTLMLIISSVSSYGFVVREIITKDGACFYLPIGDYFVKPVEDAKRRIDSYDFYVEDEEECCEWFEIYREIIRPKDSEAGFEDYKEEFEAVINEVESVLRDTMLTRYNKNYKRIWATDGALKLTFEEYFDRMKLYMATTECLEIKRDCNVISYYLRYSATDMRHQCFVGYKKKLGCCEEELLNLCGYMWSGYKYTKKRRKVWFNNIGEECIFTDEEVEQIRKENRERKNKKQNNK